MADGFDRRSLLERGGRLALAAGIAPWWRLPQLLDAVDPRVRRLDRELRGDVVAPGTPGYAQARLLFNTRYDGVRPLAIAYCESATDVAKAIAWAKREGVRLAPRSGGHSYGGYSTTTGLVIDVSRIAGIAVDAAAGSASIGAGARLIDVYSSLAAHGTTIPAGSCPSVGIAGLALGGGVGFASRRFGTTADNMRGVRIVTAAGKVLDCDASHNVELFWACRGGGGGNFGIATLFRFRIHTVGRVTTFYVRWPWANAEAVVDAWQKWAPHAPDGLFSVCNLSCAGGGEPRITASGQVFGDKAGLTSLLQPLVSTGAPVTVSTVERDYLSAMKYWAACPGSLAECHPPPKGTLGRSTFAAKSAYVNTPLSRAGIRAIVVGIAARATGPAGGASILLDSYGGAINRVPKDATAFVHRDALFSCQELSTWSPGGAAAANLAWLRAFHASLRPHVSTFAYQNYIDPDLVQWQHAYYGASYRRLQAVKKRYDPGQVFRSHQSIRPR